MIIEMFEGYGCKIVKREDAFFIRYDSGESAGSQIRESEISLEEFHKAMKSERDAYEVVLAAHNR